MGRGVAGSLCLLLLAPACFRGEFLDNTCERLPGGCAPDDSATDAATDGSSTGGSSSSGADATTEDPLACPPEDPPGVDPPPGEPYGGVAYRITDVELIDPHLYYAPLACVDIHDLMTAAVQESLDMYETNLLFVTINYDPDADRQGFAFVRDAECDETGGYCLISGTDPGTPFNAENHDEGDCVVPFSPLAADVEDIKRLHRPAAPCFRSPTVSVQVEVLPGSPPLTMYLAHFAAEYRRDDPADGLPGDCNPTRLDHGVLFGFVTRDDAIAATYDFNGTPISLWSLIRGGDGNTCEVPPGEHYDPDVLDLPGKGFTVGVYLFLNIAAERVPVYYAP